MESNKCNICGEIYPVHAFFCKCVNNNDNINNPSHYNQGKIETIDYLESCLTHEEFKGFLKGNIIKYTSRERLKGGIEDIKKGEYYKKKLITLMETGK